MARGEILEGDDIILVGHSTGGLDIRQLISDLQDRQIPEVHVDGGIPVRSADIRSRVCRVVFLSVPHWGANIADWVVSHACLRKTVVTELRAAVAGSQVYLLDQLENRIAGAAAFLTGADLLRAAQDTLTEADEHYGEPGPQRTAEAHEAAAELALYFRDMASDFHVIVDLTSQPPDSEPNSPAHFNREQRKREFQWWNDPPLKPCHTPRWQEARFASFRIPLHPSGTSQTRVPTPRSQRTPGSAWTPISPIGFATACAAAPSSGPLKAAK